MGEAERGERGKVAWAWVRLLLGMAQVMGATAAMYLILTVGMTEATVQLVIFTCFCTTVSVLLFGRRVPGQ